MLLDEDQLRQLHWTDGGIAGFAFKIARSRPILLAANKKWLVHFSSEIQLSVAFLPRNSDQTDGLVEDIHGSCKAHAFCSTKNVLWVATETKHHYYLYKIKAEQRTQRIYRIKRLEYDNLLAVSSQGFIAVVNMGLCTIFQLGKDDKLCQLFEREIGGNDQQTRQQSSLIKLNNQADDLPSALTIKLL